MGMRAWSERVPVYAERLGDAAGCSTRLPPPPQALPPRPPLPMRTVTGVLATPRLFEVFERPLPLPPPASAPAPALTPAIAAPVAIWSTILRRWSSHVAGGDIRLPLGVGLGRSDRTLTQLVSAGRAKRQRRPLAQTILEREGTGQGWCAVHTIPDIDTLISTYLLISRLVLFQSASESVSMRPKVMRKTWSAQNANRMAQRCGHERLLTVRGGACTRTSVSNDGACKTEPTACADDAAVRGGAGTRTPISRIRPANELTNRARWALDGFGAVSRSFRKLNKCIVPVHRARCAARVSVWWNGPSARRVKALGNPLSLAQKSPGRNSKKIAQDIQSKLYIPRRLASDRAQPYVVNRILNKLTPALANRESRPARVNARTSTSSQSARRSLSLRAWVRRTHKCDILVCLRPWRHGTPRESPRRPPCACVRIQLLHTKTLRFACMCWTKPRAMGTGLSSSRKAEIMLGKIIPLGPNSTESKPSSVSFVEAVEILRAACFKISKYSSIPDSYSNSRISIHSSLDTRDYATRRRLVWYLLADSAIRIQEARCACAPVQSAPSLARLPVEAQITRKLA
ncbi:hypothetical protein C8R45DRAFT_930303 [Mycena sanguinolenta]|nr:hypothetical protein C8R45DRAFT_930303 [Mycena sanguinolenta]